MKQIKPTVCKVNFGNIPDYLKKRRQWVLWRYEWVNDRWSKVPRQSNGQKAKTNDASTWSSYLKIKAAYEADGYDGVGFCFASDDGLAAIDLDHCFESNGHLSPWAKEINSRFINTYIERSPSADGLHIWCFGRKSGVRTSKKWQRSDSLATGLEVYDSTKNRYFTVTGDLFND